MGLGILVYNCVVLMEELEVWISWGGWEAIAIIRFPPPQKNPLAFFKEYSELYLMFTVGFAQWC